jgi:hypothetical protein
LRDKIDLLDRVLEVLRIEIRHVENKIRFEEFIQGSVGIGEKGLHYVWPEKVKALGSGTVPIRLQPKLLLYLLYRHQRNSIPVYEIIDSFINTIWESLDILDFKRTQTGVLRCFTNTRFAANTLRAYGLLKYTKEEAYKTWTLSLPGYLVASKMMESPNWNIPEIDKKWHFDLHPDIRIAFQELNSYGAFVQRLLSICRVNTRIFEEAEDISKRAYSLVQEYSATLQNESFSRIERRKRCLTFVKRLEQEPAIQMFHDQFMKCLKTGDLLVTKYGKRR